MKNIILRSVATALFATSFWAFFAPVLRGNEPFYDPATLSDDSLNWESSNNDVVLTSDSGESILSIVGNGETSEWLSAPVTFEPRKAYSLRFKASNSREGKGDCLCAGTRFANRDFSALDVSDVPKKNYSFVFFAPEELENQNESPVRFAQWETTREYRVSAAQLRVVAPIYRQITQKNVDASSSSQSVIALPLGEGETLDESGCYRFIEFRDSETNFSRPLYSTSCHYNTSRWVIGAKCSLSYRFALTPIRYNKSGDARLTCESVSKIPFNRGIVTVSIGYYVSGKTIVEASCDNENWVKLGEMDGLATKDFSLNDLLKGEECDELFVRLRGEVKEGTQGCNAQVHGLTVELGTVQNDSTRFAGRGETIFADLSNETTEGTEDFTPQFFDDENLYARVGDTNAVERIPLESLLTSQGVGSQIGASQFFSYAANFRRAATFERRVFPYYFQNYTSRVSNLKADESTLKELDLSWCDADYHVPRDPKVSEIQAPKNVELFASRNDYESFQIVVRPKLKPLRGIHFFAKSELKNANGDAIPKENIELRYAFYHFVDEPTDRSCAPGYYPDALIPFDENDDSVSVEKDQNLPLWVTVKTPENAAAGVYSGTIALTANDGEVSIEIPYLVNVWNFSLPERNSIDTAYGVSPGTIWRYHNCKTEADKRIVYEKYLQLYDKYRMSVYSPAPLDPIKIEWLPDANPPRCELDFSDFDKEMKRVFGKYRFTNFQLPFKGLGGGTFADRYEGEVRGYKAGSPQYEAMMADYGKKLQEHLREIGLLDAAFIYCFDEPEEKDYEFVAGEFAKLKKFAPDIRRMLTEEPSPKFEKTLEDSNAKVDIWCPVSCNYDHEKSQNQRRNNSKFWWYVCTGPKEPYCTEFTDHMAQELRIWHWQAIQRDIVGFLIWETTYWSSPTLFGDGAQNPYLDPQSYMTGYGLPAGTKRAWGNGDGRFVYPPLNAAVPGLNDGNPVYDAPNASIRIEMIRAGVQDYEMVLIFKNLLEEKSDSLSEADKARYEALLDFSAITSDMTRFSSDPQTLLERRKEIGKAIEELSR